MANSTTAVDLRESLSCLEFSYSFLQAECIARRTTCVDCGTPWGCLPRSLLSPGTAGGFACPVPCSPSTSSQCALLMVTDPTKPVFPTDMRCIFGTAGGAVDCRINCQVHGPGSCSGGVPCGQPAMSGETVSPSYLGWWECGPTCLDQIRALGLCTISAFNATVMGGVPVASSTTVTAKSTAAATSSVSKQSSGSSNVSRKATATSAGVSTTSTTSFAVPTTTSTLNSTAVGINTASPSQGSSNTWVILGATIGCIAAAIAIAVGLFVFTRRSKNKKAAGANDDFSDGRPLKRDASHDMVELTDSGRMEAEPENATTIAAAGVGASVPSADYLPPLPAPVNRPPSIWDPDFLPVPPARKPSVTTAPPSRGTVESSQGPIKPNASSKAATGPLLLVPRSASVPTIADESLPRPKPAIVAPVAAANLSRSSSAHLLAADGASLYAQSEAESVGGMNAYRTVTTSKPDIERILANVGDDADEQELEFGLSRYSSLGSASIAELHRYMLEEAQAAAPADEPTRPATPPQLALPSLNSVRNSIHSTDQGPVQELPRADLANLAASPINRLGITPAPKPSMILPSFPSVRQQTLNAAKATGTVAPASGTGEVQSSGYRLPSWYAESDSYKSQQRDP
ncbi:hypothetical protein DFJ74DRAFT_680797 [Hyaloraphidium curvatum]|nr:hypothetical protein DFJ74DRAFT_680797 [Hyaloraphidium curvatum]